MSNAHFTKILIVLTVFLVCAGMMQAQVTLYPTGTTVSLTYQKGAPGLAGPGVPVTVKGTTAMSFFVDPASVPIWLTLDTMNGSVDSTTNAAVTFTANDVANVLGAGSYYGTVKLDVITSTGLVFTPVPVTLVVSATAPTLTVSGSSGLTFPWVQGTAFPAGVTLTVSSSNEPVQFSVAVSNLSPISPANWLQIAPKYATGVAYSWGTPVVLTFNSVVGLNAIIGDHLTGRVTVTAGGIDTQISLDITVANPVAAINATNGLWPGAIPVQTTSDTDATYTILVSGSGFVSGTTAVTINPPGGSVTPLGTAGLTGPVVFVNASTLMLQIPSVTYLETAGNVVLAASNSSNAEGTATLVLTTAPIIYAVTNGASYQQQSPGATPNVAPYELISIFGDNFEGPTAGSVVSGTSFMNTNADAFPTALASGGHNVVVTFYRADGTTSIAAAPLLFVSQQQINAIVPSGIPGTTGALNTQVKIVVTYNGVASAKLLANVVTADPGIFTTNADGTGQGAILNADTSANTTTNKAAKGSIVSIYLAGMGAPTSTGTNTSQTSLAFPKSCITLAAYVAAVNNVHSGALSTVDGAVIQGSLLAHNTFPPCFATSPTVTIGGKAATVSYAGFVADSVAGLYQINALIPTTVTVGNAVPVVVTMGTFVSQPGVTVAVQ